MFRVPGETFVLFPITLLNIDNSVIAATNWFPGCDKPICRHQKHITTLFESYATSHSSGGHFEFLPPAANAQCEIKGIFSMLLRWGSRCDSPNVISPIFFPDQILILLDYLPKSTLKNFGETFSCVTIMVVNKFMCHCLIMVAT